MKGTTGCSRLPRGLFCLFVGIVLFSFCQVILPLSQWELFQSKDVIVFSSPAESTSSFRSTSKKNKREPLASDSSEASFAQVNNSSSSNINNNKNNKFVDVDKSLKATEATNKPQPKPSEKSIEATNELQPQPARKATAKTNNNRGKVTYDETGTVTKTKKVEKIPKVTINDTATIIKPETKKTITRTTTAHHLKTPHHSPTFLWGLISVKEERERRKLVRETYLHYYKETVTPNRICSLVDIQKQRVPYEECQVAYVFFVGGNPNGPTELVKPNASFPMTIQDPSNEEEDVIFLNIRENMEDGKSQTWFKYASMVVQQEYPFDYITKIDTDALVLIQSFLWFAHESFPKRPNNKLVYGGMPHGKNSCNPDEEDTHPCPLPLVGDVYMAGAFYWMSPDLADFITSESVNRSALMIRHEDVDIGNFVFSHPEKINVLRVDRSQALIHRDYDTNWKYKDRKDTFQNTLWGHSEDGYWPGPYFKNPYNFRKFWRQYQIYELSKYKIKTDNIYELFDLPTIEDRKDQLVRVNDYIYSKQDFDSSPVVLEKFKLIFFTVAGVGDEVWRCLFRRMMGYSDWNDVSRQFDGLRYLYDYNITQATTFMTSPAYTRAIFVRKPSERNLAAFLKHVVADNAELIQRECCRFESEECLEKVRTYEGFISKTSWDCDLPYWRPQGRRMERKYFSFLSFIGHYESMNSDAKRLLEKIGAWEDYGRTGWGENAEKHIFQHVEVINSTLKEKYLHGGIRKKLRQFHAMDYEISRFNFSG